ncbi:MAG: NUDIX hydrolase [Clostridia bacterium]|nr:NUDIX hydrolase [Clostridia bacterium]
MQNLDKNGLTEDEYIAKYDPSRYPHPALTADLALLCGGELLMIRRGGHPCLGMWALPGGFVNPDETVETAAARELAEETGVSGITPTLLGVFSRPGRDRRGWTASTLFGARVELKPAAHAADDARDARWFAIDGKREGEILRITLVSGDVILRAEVEAAAHISSFGCDWTLTTRASEGIAFDHAEMIALTLLRDVKYFH